MLEFDRSRLASGMIAGVDEAGRGPLAGPVTAAAVVLPEDAVIDGLNDSKKLSEKRREELFDVIRDKALAYAVYSVDEKRIDEINILQATFEAMRGAVGALDVIPDLVLVDGNRSPGLELPCETVVKGDSKSMSIAAASILAKVTRDRYMRRIAEIYPGYGFEKHKGYGTKAHYEAIERLGICDIHRRTFLKNIL
ncbi:MAG TPA: ribonuclease HII [Candidatus Ornithomonoglobus merdipullorum]|uniref:Ribonuclease HII n=1 Tax=Candidatus Ornithomonoglobus merdipullorum TaxID=2840895 RepID=A0A9D1MBB0_9FIRM|nr:ribonuclease HII [Candidatus Ornithomonoglobus merdipullorum]